MRATIYLRRPSCKTRSHSMHALPSPLRAFFSQSSTLGFLTPSPLKLTVDLLRRHRNPVEQLATAQLLQPRRNGRSRGQPNGKTCQELRSVTPALRKYHLPCLAQTKTPLHKRANFRHQPPRSTPARAMHSKALPTWKTHTTLECTATQNAMDAMRAEWMSVAAADPRAICSTGLAANCSSESPVLPMQGTY